MRGRLLNARWSLFDIDDVELFCWAIVARSKLTLTDADREDLVVYLVETCWELSLRYNDQSPKGFSAGARAILAHRVVDWQRIRFGRTRAQFKDRSYERPPVLLVSLDDPDHDHLGTSLAASGLDDGAHRLADELRSLKARGRRPGRRNGWVGDEANAEPA
jgi:hypothetical protein